LKRSPIIPDLEFILTNLGNLLEEFRNRRIFLTGGTGFFGKWLLETLCIANIRLNLNLTITILSREPAKFVKEYGYFAGYNFVTFLRGDILQIKFFDNKFDYIIHAAATSDAKLYQEDPIYMFDTIVSGTKNVLELARHCSCQKLLFISSGAVYGQQPFSIKNVGEDFNGGPDLMNPSSVYSEAKRSSELLCLLYSNRYGLNIKIARCFAFVGPYMPLDKHFAIGNFILNVLKKQNITIRGDGTPLRSYMYTSDLIIWLLTILLNGQKCYPYNVGSEKSISIFQLAKMVAEISKEKININILKEFTPGLPVEQYVPATTRARGELHLKEMVTLEEAIFKTIVFYTDKL
jgi:dTDP-glucose 4,6-dehydratase